MGLVQPTQQLMGILVITFSYTMHKLWPTNWHSISLMESTSGRTFISQAVLLAFEAITWTVEVAQNTVALWSVNNKTKEAATFGKNSGCTSSDGSHILTPVSQIKEPNRR